MMRAEEDDVRLPDRLDHLRQDAGALRLHPDAADAAVLLLLEGVDLALAAHGGAVFKLGDQVDVGIRHRQDAAGHGEDLIHPLDRLLEAVRDAVEGGEEEIAKALPGEHALREAVGEQLLHDGLHIRQGLQAVAQVPRRGHAEVLPQDAGAAAIVRHRDHGGDVAGVIFQAAQHGGKAGATADGDDMRPSVGRDLVVHPLILTSARASCPGGTPRRDSPAPRPVPPRRGP